MKISQKPKKKINAVNLDFLGLRVREAETEFFFFFGLTI